MGLVPEMSRSLSCHHHAILYHYIGLFNSPHHVSSNDFFIKNVLVGRVYKISHMTTRPLPVQPQFKEGSDDVPIKGEKKRGKRKQRKTPKYEDGDQVYFN